MSTSTPRRAVVTGAASGLGRALALDLGRRGIAVLGSDINDVGLAETQRMVREAGGRFEAARCDVTEPDEVEGLLEQAIAGLGGVDLWVNNAGIAAAGEVGELSLDDWRKVHDVNLWGMVHGCHVVTPHLREQGHGVVLNVASAAGLLSTPRMAAYNTSKAAVVALSETLYGEMAAHGIGVTVLCPTFFQTNLLSTALGGDSRSVKLAARLMARSPLSAEDVARIAIDDALAGRLYSVPMRDGRWMWRLQRLSPQSFYDLYLRGVPWVRRRFARKRG